MRTRDRVPGTKDVRIRQVVAVGLSLVLGFAVPEPGARALTTIASTTGESRGPASAWLGQTTRVSVSSTGEQGNRTSYASSLSADGRYVAFDSSATNLVAGDTNNAGDIFVHDRMTGVTTRVSVSSTGQQAGGFLGGWSWEPSISADGRYVAFTSWAENLVPDDNNGLADVFVHDLATGLTSRLSVSSAGVQANGVSSSPSISADGRYVAFSSFASNLVPGDTNYATDVFVRDLVLGTTERVSVDSSGRQGGPWQGFADDPSISADGRYVSFVAGFDNLVPGDTNGTDDVFVHDRVVGTTVRASISSTGGEANGASFAPSMSADGSIVAFWSWATNLVANGPGQGGVFAHDLRAGATTLVASPGFYPSVSADGRLVAYQGYFVPDQPGHIFVRDRTTGKTTRVSDSLNGGPANGPSRAPSISADGKVVSFTSDATDLVGGDTNGVADIFVGEISPEPLPVIFVHGINGDARAGAPPALGGPIGSEFGTDALTPFVYYQDRLFRPDPAKPACVGVEDPILPTQPDGGMPVSLDSISPSICDSQSDLSLNAVLLERRVHERFTATGRKVVLIGNSMGAAVIRGMLTYSHERGDGVAANEVDSVFFLEGAQDGAEALIGANKNGGSGIDAKLTRAFVAAVGGIDFSRPAQEGLTPQSAWYRWANPGPDRLADVPYFNVIGDIDIVQQACFLIWCLPPRTILALGDVALSTGTDDPFDTPPKGGARFLHGAPGAQNWEWSMPSQISWDPAYDQFMLGVITAATMLPQMHGNFLARMAEIHVPDCQSGADTSVDQALLRVVRGRITGTPYECRP